MYLIEAFCCGEQLPAFSVYPDVERETGESDREFYEREKMCAVELAKKILHAGEDTKRRFDVSAHKVTQLAA